MRRVLSLLLLALAPAFLIPFGHNRAEAALYWADGRSLGRANLDGSLPFWPLPNGHFPAFEANGACGLAVDGDRLYWGDPSSGAIGRVSIDGTAGSPLFITGLDAPCGVAATSSHLYWSDLDTNMIGRARIDGDGVEPAFVVGAASPCGIAVDDSHLYWANQEGSIGRAALDGGDVDQQFISGLGGPCGVAVGGGHVYWGDQISSSIGRAALDGTSVEPALVADAGEPWDVAVDGTHVFWADRWGTVVALSGAIGRAALDGSGANRDLIPGLHNPTGVALDSRLLAPPSPAPRPSDYLRFGKLTHHRDGSMRLIVSVPARGEFSLDAPAIGWSIDKGDPPPWVGGTFSWKLKLWPGKGPAAKRIRRQLRRTGRAPVVLRMTYQQEGRLPLQGSKRIAFVRAASRPHGGRSR